MVQDLIRSDADRMQIKVLNDSLNIQQISLKKQDDLMSEYKRKINVYQSTIEEYKMIDESNQRSIEMLNAKNKRYKKQRNILKVCLSVSLIGLAISTW